MACTLNVVVFIKGTVKRTESCKCVILFISRTQENQPFFKRMEILIFDTHQQLPTIIPPFKFMECQKTCDTEC